MTNQEEIVLKSGGTDFFLRGTGTASYGIDAPLVSLTLTNKQLIVNHLIKSTTQSFQQGPLTHVITIEEHLAGAVFSVPLSSIVEVTVSGFVLGGANLNIRYRKDGRIYLAWMKSASGLARGPKEWAEAINNAIKNVKQDS
jgi:hypothetical protein